MRVQYRTASSFLVAYSVNLSRGGLFLETDHELPVGAEVALQVQVPGAGSVELHGTVSWRRDKGDPGGPAGVGVEFRQTSSALGEVIDRLVADFEGLNVLLLCADSKDRSVLTRLIRSIVSTAEVVVAADPHVAETLLNEDIDLAVVEADSDTEAALRVLRHARSTARIPTVALTSNKKLRERARAAGADELASNPPPFAELQRALFRALGRPASIR
jgi:uncharacterized protein (TIGR02266 family)